MGEDILVSNIIFIMHKIDGRGGDRKKEKHQKLSILISGINTNNIGNASFPCNGVVVFGYPCQDVEDALFGSFLFSFDFNDCGGGKDNFCQEVLSKYKPSLGIISCTPSLVSRLSTGGDHCESNPVIQSYCCIIVILVLITRTKPLHQ